MRSIAALVGFISISVGSVVATAKAEGFTEVLMRSTFRIAGPDSQGTAFLLGKPDPNDKARSFFVLITAAHVLETIKGESATLFLRARNGDSYRKLPHEIRIRSDSRPLWKRHSDVDVAAMLVPIPKEADVRLASTEFLATDERISTLGVNAGDEVFVLGYPYGAEANEAGFPILRSGRIASFPLTPTAKVKTFLLDFPVFQGNSGGPVFIDQRIRQNDRGGASMGNFIAVLGIVSEEKVLTEQVKSLEQLQVMRHKLGIAVIVQAVFVSELVNSLELPSSTPSP